MNRYDIYQMFWILGGAVIVAFCLFVLPRWIG
jgi:hypothetical protein